MEHDPIEDDPKYQTFFANIDDEVGASLAKERIFPGKIQDGLLPYVLVSQDQVAEGKVWD